MKRIAFILLFAYAAIGVSATEWSGACNALINWSLSTTDSVLRLTGSGPMPDYTTDTRPPWYPYRQYIASLTMTPAITTVGTYAFADLYKMRTAQIADSVRSIRERGFYNCTALKEIHIPNRTDTVGNHSFYFCSKMEKCYLGERVQLISRYAFAYTHLGYVRFPASLRTIESYAFSSTWADTIHIPASLQNIAETAWRSCTTIDTIWVDAGNATYDSREGCSAIITTNSNTLWQGSNTGIIPDGITSVGADAFNGMSGNMKITLPNSVTRVGDRAFVGIRKVLYNNLIFAHLPEDYTGTYTIADGINEIASYAFYMGAISSVIIPATVNKIGAYAFCYCSSLTTVALPNDLTQLAKNTFQYCSSLPSITLPDSLQFIYSYCFSNCISLTAITIPDAVTTIDSYAFNYCTQLQTITIPCNLTWMAETAFDYCSNIRSIIWNVRKIGDFTNGPFMDIAEQITDFSFGDSVKYIPSNLCANMVNLHTLSVGQQVERIAPYAFDGCTGLRHVTWAAKHCADFDIYDYAPFYSARDSITHITLTETVDTIPAYLCMDMTGIRTLNLPASVRKIGPYAFRGCYNLDTITVESANACYDSRGGCNALCETATHTLLLGCNNTVIPPSILHIGESAFRRCIRLQQIDLPAGLQTIGREAFHACESLRSVELPKDIRRLEDYTFTACTGLDTLIAGDSLRHIGIRALAGCTSLRHVVLPASLCKMDLFAFAACSALERLDLWAPVPPAVYSNTFDNTTCTFYTPCAYLADYRTAEDWSLYQERLMSWENYELEVTVNDLDLGTATIIQAPACLTEAIVEAVPNEEAEFVEWRNEHKDRVSTDNPYQFAVNRDMQLTAVFRAVKNPEDGLEQVISEGTKVQIYTLTGTKVYEGLLPQLETLRQTLPQGVYVLRSETLKQKVLL